MLTEGISLIVPVFNEEEIIEETIRIFLEELSILFKNYELIIVNDASIDNTKNIIEQLVPEFQDKLKLINNIKNQGGGSSLLNGFKQAKFELVATNFADRPFDIKELQYIVPLFLTDVDFVVVVRRDRSANSLYRKLTSIVNYYSIRFLFNVKVRDFQFVQVYKKKLLQDIQVEAVRTFVPPEIIIKALEKGYRMVEYESIFHRRLKGTPKCGHPQIIFQALYDMFSFWMKSKVFRR